MGRPSIKIEPINQRHFQYPDRQYEKLIKHRESISTRAKLERYFSPVISNVSVSPIRATTARDAMKFSWSFKPIFIWLIIIMGIDLFKSKTKSVLRRSFVTFLTLFWVIGFNVLVNTFCVVETMMESWKFKNERSLTRNLNFQLAMISSGVLQGMFLLSVFVSARTKWHPLWKKLKRVQEVVGDQSSFYRQLRREILMGLLLIAVVFNCCLKKKISILILTHLTGCHSFDHHHITTGKNALSCNKKLSLLDRKRFTHVV